MVKIKERKKKKESGFGIFKGSDKFSRENKLKGQLKKTDLLSWDEVTKPLREAAKKSGLTRKDVEECIKKVRKRK